MIAVLVLAGIALVGSLVLLMAGALDRRPSVVLLFAVALVVASMLVGASLVKVFDPALAVSVERSGL